MMVVATDKDLGRNADVTYSKTGGDISVFDLDCELPWRPPLPIPLYLLALLVGEGLLLGVLMGEGLLLGVLVGEVRGTSGRRVIVRYASGRRVIVRGASGRS